MTSGEQLKPGTGESMGPVALSLSGGGGRAGAFHLGTLSTLDRLDLLKDVLGLSTRSGPLLIV